jgi:hypothetical protein
MVKYLTTAEAGAALGLDASWLRLMCRAGRVRGARKFGRNWMVPESRRPVAVRQGRPPSALTGSPRRCSALAEKTIIRAEK